MFNRKAFLLLLLVLPAFIGFTARAQTTIYIVRHAEKNLKDPADTDPPLSLDGQDRAKELAGLLLSKRMLAVYSTPFKRSRQTAQPTAYGRGLTVQTYDPADPAALASSILRQYKSGAVLIVGHSNTVLDLVEAFGIKRPIPALGEDDYDYLFAVTVQGNSVQLVTSSYGKQHRSATVK